VSKIEQSRLDPSSIDPTAVDRLLFVLSRSNKAKLVDPEGKETEIPPTLYNHLLRVVQSMKEKRAIVVMPVDEAFTTQAAAHFLGMSRQTFVNLLESKKIPFFTVGAHRRVLYKDLLEYQKHRDSERRKGLDRLFTQVEEAGLYFPPVEKDIE
jgi:excisionase family DNA binding protein